MVATGNTSNASLLVPFVDYQTSVLHGKGSPASSDSGALFNGLVFASCLARVIALCGTSRAEKPRIRRDSTRLAKLCLGCSPLVCSLQGYLRGGRWSLGHAMVE